MRRGLVTLLVLVGFSSHVRGDDKALEFFEAKIRPVLVEYCVQCHGPARQKGKLRLDTREGWQKGGDSGPALVPGKANQSLLIRMVRGGQDLPAEMPPNKKLPADVVADLVKWIDAGAHDPRTGEIAKEKGIDWTAGRAFWAFQPVKAVAPPLVKDPRWQQPLDRFIAAELEKKGLAPVDRADKLTLIRRATFDLIGLPPTRPEVEAFLADNTPGAFAKVVDRLLASSHYGEHQARAWLDIARYAEDQAHSSGDKGNLHAWRYRDWVIAAFNQDMPYDRFVKLQIAADVLEPGDHQHLSALGFFGLGAIYYKNTDIPRGIAEELDDRIDTLTRGFLGLTVSCARCHDHKYDPIPTQDYYSLAGVFSSSKLADVPVAPRDQVEAYDAAKKKLLDAEKAAKEFLQGEKDRVGLQRADRLIEYLSAAWKFHGKKQTQPSYTTKEYAESAGYDAATFGRLMAYLGRREPGIRTLGEWAKLLPPKETEITPEALAAAEKIRVQVKTNLGLPYEKRNLDIQNDLFGDKGIFPISEADAFANAVEASWATYAKLKRAVVDGNHRLPPAPALAHGIVEAKPMNMKVYLRGNPYKQGEVAPRRFLKILAGEQPTPFAQGSGRLELAEAIADAKNPLTARVIVNRVWQQHFGRGIVGTPSNFGFLGERPSHPELLDYLADNFVGAGWSIKKLHRDIMLSETYQRASTSIAKNHEADPDNRLLWRMNRRRLTVEAWRDTLLAASGNLDVTAGGPSTNLDDDANVRRTVYGKISRHDLNKVLRLFDFPDANITSDRRNETTVPQQLLFVINGPFVVTQAKSLAARLNKEPDRAAQVRLAYWLTVARPAADAEIELGVRFLEASDTPDDRNRLTRTERYAQALLASNEFVYVD